LHPDEDDHPASALGLFDLVGLVAASVPHGVRLTVEVAGVTITACRADGMTEKQGCSRLSPWR
jgi:hypothetical protein